MQMVIKCTTLKRLGFVIILSLVVSLVTQYATLITARTALIPLDADDGLMHSTSTTTTTMGPEKGQLAMTDKGHEHARNHNKHATISSSRSMKEDLALLQQKRGIRPQKRHFRMIYYLDQQVSMNDNRRRYMEEWLGRELLPYRRIQANDNFNYLQQAYLSIIRNHTQEKGMILVLEDDFKVFNKTVGRMERALRWVPNDFDIVRFDCFNVGNDLVWYNEEENFEIWTTSTNHGSNNDTANPSPMEKNPDCPYRGGTHAMVWRSPKLQALKSFFETHASSNKQQSEASTDIDCLLASPQINSYCINFGSTHQIGCFHNIKRRPRPRHPQLTQSEESNKTLDNSINNREFALETKYKERSFKLTNSTYTYRYSDTMLPMLLQARRRIHVNNQSTHLPIILIGVLTLPLNVEQRRAIRQTWGRGHLLVFIVAGEWDDVSKEFGKHKDIIWLDAPEHYKFGLTRKTMTFIDFSSLILQEQNDDKEPLFDYSFKTDDDMYINVTKIRLDLSHPRSHYNCSVPCDGDGDGRIDYYGYMIRNSNPIRDRTSKFFVSKEYYSQSTYPPYATGAGYALSRSFCKCAAKQMRNVRLLWWEDVSTGILAAACKVKLADSNWDSRLFEESFLMFAQGGNNVDVYHGAYPDEMFRLEKRQPLEINDMWYKSQRRCPQLESPS